MAPYIRILCGQIQHRHNSSVAMPVTSSCEFPFRSGPLAVAHSHKCHRLITRNSIYSVEAESRHGVIARGILDAYRKDKGLLDRQREAFKQSSEARQPVASDEDDEVCPAECVREIHTGTNSVRAEPLLLHWRLPVSERLLVSHCP